VLLAQVAIFTHMFMTKSEPFLFSNSAIVVFLGGNCVLLIILVLA